VNVEIQTGKENRKKTRLEKVSACPMMMMQNFQTLNETKQKKTLKPFN
jgi:hypothetical protein